MKNRTVLYATCLLCLLPLTLTSCGIFGGSNLSPLDELSQNPESTGDYLIQAGDVLDVQVWGESRLSGEVFVRDDGNLTMRLINDVPAEGKTAKQLGEEIKVKLGEFIPAASVTVSVVHTAPVRYYLSGKFLKPGEYRSDKRITFLQAVATGGGFVPFADESNIMLIRKGPEKDLRYELDYNRVVEGREPNPMLKSGDVIAIK